MSKVWLVTGSRNGLGRDIAEAALAAGDNVEPVIPTCPLGPAALREPRTTRGLPSYA